MNTLIQVNLEGDILDFSDVGGLRHTRDTLPLPVENLDCITHLVCNGSVQITRTRKDNFTAHCAICGLRVNFPEGMETYTYRDLQLYFEKQLVAKRKSIALLLRD